MASRSKKSLTQSQKTFVTKAYQAANLAGLSGVQADLAVSQAIHESAWGTKPSGVNNYHGIKGKGTSVRTHEIEAGKRKNITASFRNFGSMADSFKAWADVIGKKFSGVMTATNLKDAVKALRAGKPGGYATDPQYNQKITSTASRIADVATGPWGAGPAQAYAQAQYQRAMPSGPTPPAIAPVPSSRPLDSLGGLGAAYRTAALGRVAPSSPAVPVGERFGYPASPASLPAPSRFGAVTAQDDVPMQAQPRSPPMGVVGAPLGPAPAARMPDQSQRFRPDYAPDYSASPLAAAPIGAVTRAALAPAVDRAVPTPTARPDYASPQQRMAGVAPPSATVSNMLAGRNMPVSPAPAAQMATDPAKMYSYAGLTRSLAPAAPVRQTAAPVTAPAPAPSRFGPQAPVAAPISQVQNTTMAKQPSSPPIGAVSAPLGPMASPAALDAARNLGTAIAASQTPAAAAIPADPRATAYASMPPGVKTPAAQAVELSTTPEQAFDTQPAASVQTPAQAAVRATAAARPGGIPAGMAGPWGASIASQRPGQPGPYGFADQQPALDRMTTQSTAKVADPAHPPGFMGKLGDLAQRYGPQIAGSLIAGPVGGLLGGLLGASFNNAKPGQVLGNPFQGLANTAKAMGMFQSQAPYAGPKTTVGYGTRAIGSVLGGGLPAGATAYSRSTPGYSVTSLGNGVVAKTNQYGFTSYERPGGTGPTAASFSGFTGPGGMFGGGGFFGGGGGQSSGKTSGGRTSGGKSSSSSKSSGGKKSERSESAGY